ncbi:hypothetical protein CIPAW_09G064900 [Carya illinoinensis]|uniref:Uncharacterized protein n=1 Tax=Carya illinoinensis TaxID=32201 RepID=A0A8T1PJT4_CARIL|nr:hypothetical protein CIPAW_09G064900 [Carya illinoinensis]
MATFCRSALAPGSRSLVVVPLESLLQFRYMAVLKAKLSELSSICGGILNKLDSICEDQMVVMGVGNQVMYKLALAPLELCKGVYSEFGGLTRKLRDFEAETQTLMSQENMVALVSRTGRHLQRYNKGRRQVVDVEEKIRK